VPFKLIGDLRTGVSGDGFGAGSAGLLSPLAAGAVACSSKTMSSTGCGSPTGTGCGP